MIPSFHKDPRNPLELLSRLGLVFVGVAAAAVSLPWQNALILSGFILTAAGMAYFMQRK